MTDGPIEIASGYPPTAPKPPSMERHLTADQIAEAWGIHRDTVISIFRREPGVLKITAEPKKYRRGYTTWRYPQSVVDRVYDRLTGQALAA